MFLLVWDLSIDFVSEFCMPLRYGAELVYSPLPIFARKYDRFKKYIIFFETLSSARRLSHTRFRWM